MSPHGVTSSRLGTSTTNVPKMATFGTLTGLRMKLGNTKTRAANRDDSWGSVGVENKFDCLRLAEVAD